MVIGFPSENQTQYNSAANKNINYFSKIIVGGLGNMLVAGMQWLPSSYSDRPVYIEKMRLTRLNKKHPFSVQLRIHGLNDTHFGMNAFASVLDAQSAIDYGELINPKAKMTREQAIYTLKEAKDLLDLGLLKQSEYDTLKTELTPIIMDKK